MPDADCIHLVATVSSCALAAASVISKAAYGLYSRNRGGKSVHKELLKDNIILKEQARTVALLSSTIVHADTMKDVIYKKVLLFISDSVGSTWKELLSEGISIGDDMCVVRLSYNMHSCLNSICELDNTNSEFCSWADVVVADCTEAFTRCMEIRRKSYKMRLETRMEACAMCLSSKVRVYIRHIHMMSTMSKHPSSGHHIVRMCDILIFLGMKCPVIVRLEYPLAGKNVDPPLMRCATAAIENASALSFVSGSAVTTVVPSHSECIVVESSHAISRLFIDVSSMIDFPSAFIMLSGTLVSAFFVSAQSRLMTDLTGVVRGTSIDDILHIGTTTSLLRSSLTPVHVVSYDIASDVALLLIKEL